MSIFEVEAFLRENAYPFYAGCEDGDPDGWQDSMYRAILHSLSLEELSLLVECWEQDEGCPPLLFYKAQGIFKYKQRAFGMSRVPTSRLLMWYVDKKSKRVGVSAQELRKRFGGETAECRRAILKAFLAGGIKEVEWAARYLLKAPWSRSMTPLIKDAWKRTHDPLIGQVVVRHLPEAFVQEEREALSEAIGYVYVCTRLGRAKSFVINETRLNTPEYLYVFAKCGKPVDLAAVEARLDDYLDGEGWISSRDIGLVLWALGRLKCQGGNSGPGLTDLIMRMKPRFDERMRTPDGEAIIPRQPFIG